MKMKKQQTVVYFSIALTLFFIVKAIKIIPSNLDDTLLIALVDLEIYLRDRILQLDMPKKQAMFLIKTLRNLIYFLFHKESITQNPERYLSFFLNNTWKSREPEWIIFRDFLFEPFTIEIFKWMLLILAGFIIITFVSYLYFLNTTEDLSDSKLTFIEMQRYKEKKKKHLKSVVLYVVIIVVLSIDTYFRYSELLQVWNDLWFIIIGVLLLPFIGVVFMLFGIIFINTFFLWRLRANRVKKISRFYFKFVISFVEIINRLIKVIFLVVVIGVTITVLYMLAEDSLYVNLNVLWFIIENFHKYHGSIKFSKSSIFFFVFVAIPTFTIYCIAFLFYFLCRMLPYFIIVVVGMFLGVVYAILVFFFTDEDDAVFQEWLFLLRDARAEIKNLKH